MTSPARTRPGWTLAIVSIALFMTSLDNLVVGVALPVIRVDLGAGIEAPQALVGPVGEHEISLVQAPRPTAVLVHTRAGREPLREDVDPLAPEKEEAPG